MTTPESFKVLIDITEKNVVNLDLPEIKEAIEQIASGVDFTIELDSQEYRLIHEEAIDAIWGASLEEQIKECYEIPKNLEDHIDYAMWIKEAKAAGMGSHFSTYDSSELYSKPFYIFRTN